MWIHLNRHHIAKVCDRGKLKRSLAQGLAGNRATVHARASNEPLSFDHRHRATVLGSGNGRLLARGPTTDHCDVEVFHDATAS